MKSLFKYTRLFFIASFIGLCIYILLASPIDSILMWVISKVQNIPSVCTHYLEIGGGENVLDVLGCNNLRFTVELFSIAIVAGLVVIIMDIIRDNEKAK